MEIKIGKKTRSQPALKKSQVGPKFASKLKKTLADKAVYSLDDARIAKLQEAYANFDGDFNKLVIDTLKELGEDWRFANIGHYGLSDEDGLAQDLYVGLEEGKGVRLETYYKQQEGEKFSYHREILSKDDQGEVSRERPQVITTHAPQADLICTPVDKLFRQDKNAVAQTYYREPAEATSLQSQIKELQQAHTSHLEELKNKGSISSQQVQSREASFGQMIVESPTSEQSSKELRELETEAFHLLHHPQNVADGLYRGRDFYVSPGHLEAHAVKAGWDMETDQDGKKIPILDAVVVGAGPGGLSTAHQLARRGARVVTFEAETAGSSFSDAGAKSVHHLRTTPYLTNILRDGFDYITAPGTPEAPELEHPASLLGRREEYQDLAKKGREGLESLVGTEIKDIPSYPQGYEGTSTRGMFFAHLAKVADSVAQDFPDSFLCERSPVENVSFEDGLYTVTTARGHKVKAKELVLASGLTGSDGQNARNLGVLKEFSERNPQLFENLSDPNKLPSLDSGPLLLQERSLGNQAVRQTLQALPEGSRAAMIGSGESALKGALELLQLNPGLSVDLFVKGPVDAAQVQIPPEYFFSSDAILATPNSDERARSETKRYGSPVTPRSLQLLFEYQTQGRARLLELGEYFDENSVSLALTGNKQIEVNLVSSSAKQKLEEGRASFQKKNLLPDEGKKDYKYDALIQAIGYEPPAVEKLDFLARLDLPEEAGQSFHVNTTGAPEHQLQTTIPGMAISGRIIAEKIASSIPEERRKSVAPKEVAGVRVYSYLSQERLAEVPYFLESGGLTEQSYGNTFRAVRPDGSPHFGRISRVVLTEYDDTLRKIYDKPTAERSPAEQETLERGVRLAEKMRGMHLPSREEMPELLENGTLREVMEN